MKAIKLAVVRKVLREIGVPTLVANSRSSWPMRTQSTDSHLGLLAMTVTMASFPGSVGDTGHEALQRHWLDDALSPLEQRVRAQPVGNRIGFDG